MPTARPSLVATAIGRQARMLLGQLSSAVAEQLLDRALDRLCPPLRRVTR